jgi:hypothetical protein
LFLSHNARIPSKGNKTGERNTRDSNTEGRNQIVLKESKNSTKKKKT